ncbi:MAG: MerR family transcriptional regulator [Ferruginibacter sp.]
MKKHSQIAFDFDVPPPQKEETPKLLPPKQVEAPVVNETPVEVPEMYSRAEKPVKEKKIKERKSTRGRMKLSDMELAADLVEVPEDEELFSKRYYTIGAVAAMFKVNVSLLRFWENEFDILKPKKNGKGDRLFRPEDVKNLKMIHHLLRQKKYTIEGAKDFIKKNKQAEENYALIENLQKLRSFLNELKANL